MRAVKFISIFIFLTVFINGKINAPVLKFETKKNHSSTEIKTNQKINSDNDNDDSEHKRKRRLRGIEVDVPQISNISFEQLFVFKVFKPLFIERSSSSFLHCIPLKRGPPIV